MISILLVLTGFILRVSVYTAVADLVHHVRNELTAPQLERIISVYSAMMHDPTISFNLHTLFAKMMFGLADAILAKETPQGAAQLLGAMFETCLERLEGLCVVHSQITPILERNKQKSGTVSPSEEHADLSFIEKSRPLGGAVYLIEKPEDAIQGILLRIHSFETFNKLFFVSQNAAPCSEHFYMASVYALHL